MKKAKLLLERKPEKGKCCKRTFFPQYLPETMISECDSYLENNQNVVMF